MVKTLEIIAFVLFAGFMVMFLNHVFNPRDDTDGRNRSGLVPLTDCLTGRQYLATRWGGMVPRLDGDGNQRVDRSACK